MIDNPDRPRAMALPKPRRQRGVILTPQGLKKLQLKIQDSENQQNLGYRYTLEVLSEKTELDPRTIAKVLRRVTGVDKRTLDCFFRDFHLELGTNDYSKPNTKFEQFLLANTNCYQQGNHSTTINISREIRAQAIRMLFQILATIGTENSH